MCATEKRVVFGRSIGWLFTDDPAVVKAVASIMTVVPLFAVLDGVSCVLQGVIRGLGDQTIGAVGNFIAYYIVGIPLGAALCFWFGFGVTGIWMGSTCGLAVAIAILVYSVRQSSWQPKVGLQQQTVLG